MPNSFHYFWGKRRKSKVDVKCHALGESPLQGAHFSPTASWTNKESHTLAGIDDTDTHLDEPLAFMGGMDGFGRPRTPSDAWTVSSSGPQVPSVSLAHRSSQQIKFITASNYNYSLKGLHNGTVNENDKWKWHGSPFPSPPNLRLWVRTRRHPVKET